MNRTRLLLGEGADRLRAAAVAVFGVGGVGGYCAEFLARAGVGRIALVDADRVSASNKNRQVIALDSTVGRLKAQVCAERIKDINAQIITEVFPIFYDKNTAFDFSAYDVVLDCIDTVSSKVALALACRGKTRLISCMGTGNKLCADFEIADIYQTSVCPLARAMRKLLKEAGVSALPVVFSREQPAGGVIEENGRHAPASISYVPAAAAAKMTEYAVAQILSPSAAKI